MHVHPIKWRQLICVGVQMDGQVRLIRPWRRSVVSFRNSLFALGLIWGWNRNPMAHDYGGRACREVVCAELKSGPANTIFFEKRQLVHLLNNLMDILKKMTLNDAGRCAK